MKDGRTRRVGTRSAHEGEDGFLATHEASIVIASGPMAGSEVLLEKARVTLGRGTGCDVVLDHASISSEHAALELHDGGYRLRDLGSTNGVRVNGAKVSAADLKHGDRFELGALAFRYVVEERESAPPTHVLLDES
jgi:pSer/pThr/pTyr-binding forkhead associated (FHA) protein